MDFALTGQVELGSGAGQGLELFPGLLQGVVGQHSLMG